MVKRRKRYNDESMSEKKQRLQNEMGKYKYFDKKIKQLTFDEVEKQ